MEIISSSPFEPNLALFWNCLELSILFDNDGQIIPKTIHCTIR